MYKIGLRSKMYVLGWSFLPCLWSPICNNFWNYVLFEWHFVNVKKSLCQCCELISLMHIWERDELLFVVNGRLRHATFQKLKGTPSVWNAGKLISFCELTQHVDDFIRDLTQQGGWKTKDGRMTKKCCIRPVSCNIFCYSSVPSLPAVLLLKVPTVSYTTGFVCN